MNGTDTAAWSHGLAGVWPGDDRLSARLGDRLAALPGRWRWGIERLFGWWLGELADMVRIRRRDAWANGAQAHIVDESEQLQFAFTLPPEALGLVRERIALTVEERTPFTVDEVLAAYRLEGDGREVKVVVRLVPIARLAPILPETGVRTILLAARDGPLMAVTVPATLLEPVLRDIHRRTARRRRAVTGAIVLALLSALLVPIWARREAVAREQALLDHERAVMAPLIRRAAVARSAERAAADALRLRSAVPSPLPVLDHLTGRIGDDSYLTEFRLAERDGVIAGYTMQASALPGPLEADPLLADVRLTGPVSRDGRDGRQRFEIAFRVVR